MRYADLILINADRNNNRSCVMKQISDTIFVSEIKRVDDKGRAYPRKFPMTVWDSYYADKLKEGYIDRNADNSLSTRLVKTTSLAGNWQNYKPIEDKKVRCFWEFLLEESQKALHENYDIEAEKVSAEMIQQAKKKIEQISLIAASDVFTKDDIRECNALLTDLFILIPRKMAVVSDCLITNTDDVDDPHYIGNVLTREEDLLAAMDVNRIMKHNIATSELTHPESLGIHIQPHSRERERAVKEMMGNESYLYSMGFTVCNDRTRRLFDAYCQKSKIKTGHPVPPTQVQHMHHIDRSVIQVYHGTANINGLSLLAQGFKRHANAKITGRLFGDGGYGALQLLKSLGYCDIMGSFWRHGRSDKGIMFLYNVAVTQAKHLTRHSSGGVRHYTAENISPYDTVYAHRGYNMGYSNLRNDEIIAYRPDEGQMDVSDVIFLKGSLR